MSVRWACVTVLKLNLSFAGNTNKRTNGPWRLNAGGTAPVELMMKGEAASISLDFSGLGGRYPQSFDASAA